MLTQLLARIVGLYRFCRYVLRRWREDQCPQIAGSLAFTTLLVIVPIFAVAVALLSRAPFFEQVLVQIKVFLLLNLVPEIAGRIITVYMEEFAANAVRLSALGTVVIFVGAVTTMLTVDRSIHQIWRERRVRPLWITILAYAALLLVSPLLIGISVSITTYLISLSAQADVSKTTHSFLLQAMPASVSAVAFFLIYRLVPHRPVKWQHALAGALVACVLFEGAKELFAIYVANVPGYNILYGAFVALPFFLLWIYVSWLVVLFGAELTAALGNWPEERTARERRREGQRRQEGET